MENDAADGTQMIAVSGKILLIQRKFTMEVIL